MRTLLVFAVVLGAFPAPGACAQEAGPPSGIPSELAEEVRTEVASRWEVAEEDVVLDFAAPRGEARLAVDGGFELVGSGSGGHWVLRAATVEGDTESLRLRAGLRLPRRVAARRIERGEVLLASDMREEVVTRWGGPRPSSEVAVEGWVAQRLVREGEALVEPAVQPPLAVRSGESVEVLWTRGGVGVRAPARAAGSAGMGQQVYVRVASGARLRGVVVAPGLVNVTQGGTQ